MSRYGLLAATLTLLSALAFAATSPRPRVVKDVDWQKRSMAWFGEAQTPKAQRKAMRQFTKALRRPCKYCHTRDFKGWTDPQLRLISQQMMALSVEHKVSCKECHKGKKGFTELGEKAQPMWDLAREKGVSCEHCHVPGKRFEELTKAGKEHKATLKK